MPNPLLLIPFARDPDFVERGAVLTQIQQGCALLGSKIALVGLGGVGYVNRALTVFNS